MPAKLSKPKEIIKKEAVLADSYITTQIFVNLGKNSYIRINYDILDIDGVVIGKTEAILDSVETAQFISDNPTAYAAIKEASYSIGKINNVIDSTASIV